MPSDELLKQLRQIDRMIDHWEGMSGEASRVGNIALAEQRHGYMVKWAAKREALLAKENAK